MSNIREDEYRNVDEYRCELRSGYERATNLLEQLKNARREYDAAEAQLKNKDSYLAECDAKVKKSEEKIERHKRYRHWYFYVLWCYLYMIYSGLNAGIALLLIGSLFDAKYFLFAVFAFFAFLGIYIPFRRWSLRIAEPEGDYDDAEGRRSVGVEAYLTLLCVPVISQGLAFLLPALIYVGLGLRNGLYYKEQELYVEWEKYFDERKKYQNLAETTLLEIYERCLDIESELEKLYRCENCKHATAGPYRTTYTCEYQSGLRSSCEDCNVKK